MNVFDILNMTYVQCIVNNVLCDKSALLEGTLQTLNGHFNQIVKFSPEVIDC